MRSSPLFTATALTAVLALVPAPPAPAQAPPSTDIYLVPLADGGDGTWTLGTPTNATDRDGYDNQPAFLPDGSGFVYTTIDGAGQADIAHYQLAGGTVRAAIATADTSEYSPTPIEGGKALSVVRVESDGSQRLWRFPLDGGAPSPILPDLAGVGYHTWIDDRSLLLFVLGEPPTLQRASAGPGAGTVVAENVGRALARIPGSVLMSFVHKTGDGWWLTSYHPQSGELRPLVATRPEREDYAWAPDGSLWMGDGSQLYRWRPRDDGWHLVGDLAAAGVRGITRLAVHPDGRLLAVVGERPSAESAADAGER